MRNVKFGVSVSRKPLPSGRAPVKIARIARVGAIKDYKAFDRANIIQRNAYAPTQPERIVYLPAPSAAVPVESKK